ncbi:MAG: PEP-CTERM sorting domain-containing protein [Phycisphaerales bacterium]|nr:PEP-CTERM sorting domain-containing protein [Phycisphaerales bacterium]
MQPSAFHLGSAFLIAAVACASHAQIVNPSFEEFDTNGLVTGWTFRNDPTGEFTPWFDDNHYGGIPNPGAGAYAATISYYGGGEQIVTLNAGDVVLFDVNFVARIFPYPCDGGLQVWLLRPDQQFPTPTIGYPQYTALSTPTLFSMYWPGTSPESDRWLTGSVTAPSTGTYTLGFWGQAFQNRLTEGLVQIDNFRVVPAPSALLFVGLGGILIARRRR